MFYIQNAALETLQEAAEAYIVSQFKGKTSILLLSTSTNYFLAVNLCALYARCVLFKLRTLY